MAGAVTVDIPARVDRDHTLRQIVILHESGWSPEQIIDRLGRRKVETAVRAVLQPIVEAFRKAVAQIQRAWELLRPIMLRWWRAMQRAMRWVESERARQRTRLRKMHTAYSQRRRARRRRQ